MSTRDWDNPEYKKFRRIVRRRDKYTCQMPNCKSKKAIKVHHIFTWAKFPSLRYDPNNGIVLCRVCHDKISKVEHYYIKLFLRIVSDNNKRKK